MTPYTLTLRVYYEDTDAGGIVYHARYLAFAERARTEALRQAGVPHAELVDGYGLIFVVHRVEMDYLRPARLDDELVVTTGPWALGAATIEVRQVFTATNGTVGSLLVKLACVRRADGRPARIPDRWRAALS
jgi:acyl-CoA thioester hydrolase